MKPIFRKTLTRLFYTGLILLTVADRSPVFADGPRHEPPRNKDRYDQRPHDNKPGRPQQYSLEQAVSDQAQLHTIAFNGLAFITGDFGASTFLPPGKMCDFFGFQYMRDIDTAGKGHNPMFLDRVAGNVFYILTPVQRKLFAALATEQAPQLQTLAIKRLPLIAAFHQQLNGKIPGSSTGLSRQAVQQYVGGLFADDARLSYRRAEVMGRVATTLSATQKAYLARMTFGNFNSWPNRDVRPYKLPRGTDKMVNVAYMTYASEFFSWYAGSVTADTYFCPERHGTYFGGFFMKDMPAMGKRDYDISTAVTGDSGRAFMARLNSEQRGLVTGLVLSQRGILTEIIAVRRGISIELRKFINGQRADRKKVIALGRRYGELDGELSWLYALVFSKVKRSLTDTQRRALLNFRNLNRYSSAPAYLYSDALRSVPRFPVSAKFFF